MKRLAIVCIVVAGWAGVGRLVTLEACGDKFMLGGRGLSFEAVYQARYPGSVVIDTAGVRTDAAKLEALLTRAGHHPRIMASAAAEPLTDALQHADVVFVPLASLAGATALASRLSGAATVLPILPAGNKAEKAACQQLSPACDLKAKDALEKFVLAANAAMVERRAGPRAKAMPAR